MQGEIYNERATFRLLRLNMADFRRLIELMLEAFGQRPASLSIDVEHGRRKSPSYRSLDELLADTRLPDELSNVTVFAYTSYDEPNRLTIRFSTFLQPSLCRWKR